MPGALPLPTLLSQALVAMTIELDNELELRMPHFMTTGHKIGVAGRGPWLVSWAMWANFLQYVEPAGTPRDEIQARARVSDQGMHTALEGMTRWGYVGSGTYQKGGSWKGAAKDALVTLTPAGASAQSFFPALPATVEQRWRDRFGPKAVKELAAALAPLVRGGLPAYVPIARYATALRAEVSGSPDSESREGDDDLVTLLARVLLGFALEYEADSDLSLAIAANFLRVLDGDGELVRELPRVTGASKEAITFGVGFLEKSGYAAVGPDSDAPKAKRARLTAKGKKAAGAHVARVAAVESAWQKQFGKGAVTALRAALQPVVGDGTPPPAPDGTWRTLVKAPDTLPHHPLVLHRGGYPDGA